METATQNTTTKRQHPYTGESGPVCRITPAQENDLALGLAIQLPDGQWVYGESHADGGNYLYREALACDYGGNVYARRVAPEPIAGLLGNVAAPGIALRRQYRDFVGFFEVA